MSIPTRPDGGPATPVTESTNEPIGSVAIPVYEVDADAPVLGGAAVPVLVITDDDLIENGGMYHLDGRPVAFPISTKSFPHPVQAGKALPIYVVNGQVNPPDAPTGLTATNDVVGQIDLSWNVSVGATSYNIKRATVDGGPYTAIQEGNVGTTFSDTTAVNGTTYYYVVSAVNDDGESGNSNQASGVSLNWWEAGGAAGCVAAYKPKGSASLAASYTNLANPGTNDAAPGVAPTWDSTDGWTFDGTSQYLTGNLSIQPSVLSALVRFSGHSGTGWLFGVFTSDSGNHIIRIIPSLSGSVNYCNGGVSAQSAAPAITSGVLGIAGTKAYRNGVDEGLTLVGAGTVTKPIFIAARNSVVGSPFNFASVKIQAIAFYNQVLDATAMAAVASAMAAL